MRTSKKRKNRWKIWTIVTSLIAIIVSFGGSIYLFVYSIVSKKLSGMTVEINKKEENTSAIEIRQKAQEWYCKQKFETIELEAEDGVHIKGYFLKSEDSRNQLAILVHGYASSSKGMAEYAKMYYEEGVSVFLADNRAHGESEGNYIGMGLLDSQDYLLWIDKLLPMVGNDVQIVLHGVSMGAATVMMMCNSEHLPEQVKCIIEDCGYTSVFDEFKYQLREMFHLPAFPILYLASMQCKALSGYSFKEASAVKAVKHSKVPIFFIHGEEDTFNPTEMVNRLYNAANCEKELWIVPEAAHAKSHRLYPEEYRERVVSFYTKYLER